MDFSFSELIINWIAQIISSLGYPGIFALMFLESALIPIPSEVVMTFSGFLVSEGEFNLFGIVIAGFLGNMLGASVSYSIGYWGHDRFIKKLVIKFGKYILLTEAEYNTALHLFKKYGLWTVAVARFIPGLRVLISTPAGVVRLPFVKFSLITAFGSFCWVLALSLIGLSLGENWDMIRIYLRKYDTALLMAIIVFVGVYIYYKYNKIKSAKKT